MLVKFLQFADDLVLLSHSKDELQNNLNKLEHYCQTWRLKININKSKVMKLNLSGKLCNDTFTINGEGIECVKEYKYLGIMLTSSGQFTTAQKLLCQKSMKCAFKLKNIIRNSTLNPHLQMKLFDNLISTILLYNSEIWGVPKMFPEKNDNNCWMYDSFEKTIAEKIHLNFCRFAISTNQSANKAGVRGELGRYPMQIKIWISILKFINHILGQDENSFVYKAFDEQKQLLNLPSWLQNINTFCDKIKLFKASKHSFQNIDISQSKSYICGLYEKQWRVHLKSNSRLNHTYSKIKHNLCYEPYLNNITNIKHRKTLTSIRISTHKLHFELGRHNKSKIDKKLRTCKFCPDDIEDEFHLLIKCNMYNNLRTNLYKDINELCSNFKDLAPYDKLIYMLTAENEIAKLVAKYCYEALIIRDSCGQN